MPEMPLNAYLDVPLHADPQYHFHFSVTEELNAQLSTIGSSLLRFAATLARTDLTRPPHLQDLVEKDDILRAAELLFGPAMAHQHHLAPGEQFPESVSQATRSARPGATPIFLSYASDDGADFAKRLLVNLKRHRLGCFYAERSIPAASDWRNEIWNAMENCKVVVLVVTPRFVDSHWCTGEVGAALSHNKPVVPILRSGGILPDTVDRLHAMKVDKPADMRKLIRLLKQLCA